MARGSRCFRFIVGRGPVPRHAAVCRNLARDRPSPYGRGEGEGGWGIGGSRETGPRATV